MQPTTLLPLREAAPRNAAQYAQVVADADLHTRTVALTTYIPPRALVYVIDGSTLAVRTPVVTR